MKVEMETVSPSIQHKKDDIPIEYADKDQLDVHLTTSLPSAMIPPSDVRDVKYSSGNISIIERIHLLLRKDGTSSMCEVSGNVLLPSGMSVRLNVSEKDREDEWKDYMIRTHPHVDRKLLLETGVLTRKGEYSSSPKIEIKGKKKGRKAKKQKGKGTVQQDSESQSILEPLLRYKIMQTSSVSSEYVPIFVSVWSSIANNRTSITLEVEKGDADVDWLEFTMPEIHVIQSEAEIGSVTLTKDKWIWKCFGESVEGVCECICEGEIPEEDIILGLSFERVGHMFSPLRVLDESVVDMKVVSNNSMIK
ncbi:hypothetical protein ADUPG1_009156 [Aduncisulcus paluster]|uniref:Uncharacterized protein n=1 Tax=Aduncisulcus paluster TaxID=2918883 RepID=A0ABQ5KXH6_9EUKA|nr:hypothetical protein ADUPG1_009156 [Aduncisulcus paluster]